MADDAAVREEAERLVRPPQHDDDGCGLWDKRAECTCGASELRQRDVEDVAAALARARKEALLELKAKAQGFADADYAHAAQGGGIYFSADHLRGSAAAYVDMTKHIDQAIRALGARYGLTAKEVE